MKQDVMQIIMELRACKQALQYATRHAYWYASKDADSFDTMRPRDVERFRHLEEIYEDVSELLRDYEETELWRVM